MAPGPPLREPRCSEPAARPGAGNRALLRGSLGPPTRNTGFVGKENDASCKAPLKASQDQLRKISGLGAQRPATAGPKGSGAVSAPSERRALATSRGNARALASSNSQSLSSQRDNPFRDVTNQNLATSRSSSKFGKIATKEGLGEFLATSASAQRSFVPQKTSPRDQPSTSVKAVAACCRTCSKKLSAPQAACSRGLCSECSLQGEIFCDPDEDTPPVSRRIDLELSREDDRSDAQLCADYAQDIYDALFANEAEFLPLATYLDAHPEINSKMRAILVDWLVEVHTKYQLRAQTLFLAVNMIDRYLSSGTQVLRRKLQLVGVAAMFIASKFEEIDPPHIHKFVYIADNAYTKDEILQCEVVMLAALKFDIVVPTSIQFLDRLVQAYGCDSRHRSLARYLLELTLVDYSFISYMPSQLAAASLLVANELLGLRTAWPDKLARCARYTEAKLQPCTRKIQALLETASTSSVMQAVRKKFQSREHHCVASLYPSTLPSARRLGSSSTSPKDPAQRT
eukprot:TRINITY_DN110166_c0_g1_i1.p1 TRINITY_DN110166_c0_g1~~TRINITY_DN110166_c0_g1_i1.p1  ORF type:complete len:514 (-),score=89.25 TRINITY_DN110166_c0_g1_i1:250-1791(-)